MQNPFLIVPIFIILMIACFIFIPRFMIQRAIAQIIAIFRRHNALQAESAKTRDELGLSPLGFFKKITSPRDYKPTALDILINAGIIISTFDGRMYLVEEKLNEFPKLRGWK